jgi:hypothetical protein
MQKDVGVARLAILGWHMLQETEEKQDVMMILFHIQNLTNLKITLMMPACVNGSQ